MNTDERGWRRTWVMLYGLCCLMAGVGMGITWRGSELDAANQIAILDWDLAGFLLIFVGFVGSWIVIGLQKKQIYFKQSTPKPEVHPSV